MDRTTYVNELHNRFSVPRPVIVTVVERATDRKVATAHRVIRGDEYEVHRVHLTDGSVVYLRVAWPGSRRTSTHFEAWAMGQARDAGLPVPEVLAVESIESAEGDRAAMVLREAPGRQLRFVLPLLSADRRAAVLGELGRTPRALHAVAMPGAGVPDDHGRWEDPETSRRGYLAAVSDDSRHLGPAGLTSAEVDRVLGILHGSIVPLEDPPVLCHGDVSPEHVFVDAELRVVGLIDWGMWHASSAASELAGLGMLYRSADLDTIIAGHGFPTDSAAQDQIHWHTIAQASGQIRWLVVSNQGEEVVGPVTALRTALSKITG